MENEKAKELRRAGEYDKAIVLYKQLWETKKDLYDGAGLLYCYRKKQIYQEAIPLAKEVAKMCKGYDWPRNEVVWTYYYGILNAYDENVKAADLKNTVDEILSLDPNTRDKNRAILKVLQLAKKINEYGLIDEYAVKIDSATLNKSPMVLKAGKEGWSEYAIWLNYRIQGLTEAGEFDEVIRILNSEKLDQFQKQKRHFLHLLGNAYYKKGVYKEADNIYKNLTEKQRNDCWILHDHALVKMALDHKNEALSLMYQSADSGHDLRFMINVFYDIGELCLKMNKNMIARAHFALSKFIRISEKWRVPDKLTSNLQMLNDKLGIDSEPKSLQEALIICQKEWGSIVKQKSAPEKSVIGSLTGIINGRAYCFIEGTDKRIFFCFKNDLPVGATNGCKLKFDAISSFDKKKNKEGWKALNISLFR